MKLLLSYCYARLHGNGSYFLPFFWFLEFRKIYVSAIISSQAICFLASFTMVLQKKCKEPKNGIPKSWEDKLIGCPLSLKMSIFCKNGPEKWTLWPKLQFLCHHIIPQCLRSTKFIRIRLFCKIGELQGDLLPFSPENGNFWAKKSSKNAF